MNVVSPVPLQFPVTEKDLVTAPWRSWLSKVFLAIKPLGDSGTTAQRPTADLYVGLMFFDTTLGLPVYVKTVATPAVWVNAAGAVV